MSGLRQCSVSWMRFGTEAAGVVASDDPFVAFGDAIREFSPDHLLIAVRSQDRVDWQERGLLDQLFERFAVPMAVFSPTPRG
jgi:hypothetical protein